MSNTTSFKVKVKRKIKWPLISVVASLPDGLQSWLFTPSIRRCCERVPVLRVIYSGCYRTHPIDRYLGTDTGGIYPAEPINGLGVGAGSLPYMGSQPSIVRKALDQLGDVHGKSFIDIGCGKGRPMLVATEYPFKEVLGYDLAPRLVNIANRNAKLVARRFPQRTPMRAYVENALEMALPRGDVVIFLFNPFGASIMTAFLRKLEEGLADSTLKHLNIVYCNPVCAHVFDQSPKLTRRYSALVPYAPEEIGYGTEAAQDVMIWSSVEA